MEEFITNKLARREFLNLGSPTKGQKKKSLLPLPVPMEMGKPPPIADDNLCSILTKPTFALTQAYDCQSARLDDSLDDTQFWKLTRTEAPFLLP